MSTLITIFGGSGFLGRQVARIMAQQGCRVRIAVRRPNEALFVRTYGAVGQVSPIFCNVRDDASVLAAMSESDAVVNCVDVKLPAGNNTFDAVHDKAAGRIARLSRQAGVPAFVHVSTVGADPESDSHYAAAKGRGEIAVREARPDAVILRPTVMFGMGDTFYNRLGTMARNLPVMLVPGLGTKVQPVYVEDVARAVSAGLQGKVPAGVYELGGPDVMTMRQVVDQVLAVTGHRRLVIGLPRWLAGIIGGALDFGSTVTGKLFKNKILTRDQVRLQTRDNVARDGNNAPPLPTEHIAPAAFAEMVDDKDARLAVTGGFEPFGITPVASDSILPEYLWPYRDSGQYAEIKASAKNLRSDS
ncbi:complex I NDUFA9 subunit family protein [Paracoccus pacificus]|uniref:Complex I NDUFA9 subunit family protein n=1 Tax=Paracoccus pacificus TaxID=1463598 RepID=A0ABW4R715_9RHOB